ncbi:hypothetical protein SASPL_110614 [Salvia splendens]|uniref:Uncharacterized protein n=1 Tax=Salvia splendens TaxID=180675 RepID=A0A8X8YAY6_SALSN|nr:hypothetical protein SASPL_110614 [Salvia splendens]
MMESRMDAVDRRVENLCRKQYPSPHQSGRSRNIPDGFFSRHPEDAANRCIGYPRAPPLPEPPPHRTPSPPSVQRTLRSYLPHSQPPAARSNYRCYTARKKAHQPPPDAFTAGDQFKEQELRRIPHSAPRTRPTMYSDPPKKCIQLRVSVDEPQPLIGWPLRPQPSPLHQPACWDPPKQQEYSTHEPPTHVDPLDRGFIKFQPLPQPPLLHRFRSAVDENRCYGEVVTHTHSPTFDGNEELCDSEDSILDKELCDSETLMDRDRGLPSENWGSREEGVVAEPVSDRPETVSIDRVISNIFTE